MLSKKPTGRQISWAAVILQFVFIEALVFFFGLFIKPFDYALNLVIFSYLFLFLLLRNLVPRNHRKGIRLVKAGNYAQAIEEFEKSYDFFTRHAWIDKYRYVVLLSVTRMSYKEMALINSAFCYTQIGEGHKAREYYEKALRLYPNNEMAKAALRMLDSVSGHE